MSKEKAHVEEPEVAEPKVEPAPEPVKPKSPVAIALREWAAIVKCHGSFNDLAVNQAFASMAKMAEQRAEAIG